MNRSVYFSLALTMALIACSKPSSDSPAPSAQANAVGPSASPTPAPPQAPDPTKLFGGHDSKGGNQVAVVSGFSLTTDYFPELEQASLKSATGRGVVLKVTFQDGVLKSRNPKSNAYPQLDLKQDYGYVYALVGFDSPVDAKAGLIRISGRMELVTGEMHYGPVGVGGEPQPEFEQDQNLFDPKLMEGDDAVVSAAGRVHSVGLHSSKTDLLTLDEAAKDFGPNVKIAFP